MDIDQFQGHPPWKITQVPSVLWIPETKIVYILACLVWLRGRSNCFVPQNIQTGIVWNKWTTNLNIRCFLLWDFKLWANGLIKNAGILGRVDLNPCNVWFQVNTFIMITFIIYESLHAMMEVHKKWRIFSKNL